MQPKWEREGGWCLHWDPTVGERGPSGGRTHTIRNGTRRRSPGLMRSSAGIALGVVGRGRPIRMARREEHRPQAERLQDVGARLARRRELLQQLRRTHSHPRISGVRGRTAERGGAGGSEERGGTCVLWEGVRGRRPGLVRLRSNGSAGCGSAGCGVAGPRSAELMAAGAAAAAEVFIIEVGGWRPLHVGLWGWRADANGR